MVSLGYGCYTILSDALQLYIASGKRFIILARPQVSTLVLTKSIFASYTLNTKWIHRLFLLLLSVILQPQ